MNLVSYAEAIALLKRRRIGVLPTDTLYGLVASALDQSAVERVYRARGRDEGKPCIVLIGDISDLERFGIRIGFLERGMLESVWPGKVSVVLPCQSGEQAYLHRDTETIAFRLPDNDTLRVLLRETGPLIAPSANLQGKPPAKTILEAESYFGDSADFYIDGGVLDSAPSTVASIEDGTWNVLREGAGNVL